jgi:hypothetical protein
MGAAGLAAAPGFAEQQTTTADEYKQNEVDNSTSENIVEKKVEQGEDIANTNRPVQAKMLSESQDLRPFGLLPPFERDDSFATGGTKNLIAPVNIATDEDFADPKRVQKQMESDMVGEPSSLEKVTSFLGQKNLEPVLVAAMQKAANKEEMIGSGFVGPVQSPLTDNPDIAGGEDDDKLPGVTNFTGAPRGTVISPSTTLSPTSDDLDNILSKALANKTPQERETVKQQMLRNMNASREGFMAQDGPNKPAFDAKQRILEKTGQEREARVVGAPSTSDKANNFLAMINDMSEIEASGPRTDIQVGGLTDKKLGLGKSVGISYTKMNGDTKVGFNIMPDPTKPQEVKTYEFLANPKAMESMESDNKFSKLFNLATRRKGGFSSYEA